MPENATFELATLGDVIKNTLDAESGVAIFTETEKEKLEGLPAGVDLSETLSEKVTGEQLAVALSGKADLESPSFTGLPTGPTATPGTNTAQLASTAFVHAVVAALIDSSPGSLDTLNELAAALGDDADFAATMTNALAAKADKTAAINTQADSYTLAITDNGKIVEMNGAGAKNVTVPSNADVALPIGAQILVSQVGAGQVSFVAGAGVTIHTAETLKLAKQYAAGTLYQRSVNEWVLIGNLEAV